MYMHNVTLQSSLWCGDTTTTVLIGGDTTTGTCMDEEGDGETHGSNCSNASINNPSCVFATSCLQLVITLLDLDAQATKDIVTKYCIRIPEHITTLLMATKNHPFVQLEVLQYIVQYINESDEYNNEYLSELFTHQQVSHYVR